MNRRRFLISGVAAASAASFALGTGAFSSVSAERSVTVEVADDDSAFLRMEELVNEDSDGEPTGRSGTFGREVFFSIPGKWSGENPNAEGVGADSVYEFHDLLRVTNQGTQAVELYSSYDGDALANLALVGDNGVLRANPPTLDVGEEIDVGLHIDSENSEIGDYEETLTIVATQVEE